MNSLNDVETAIYSAGGDVSSGIDELLKVARLIADRLEEIAETIGTMETRLGATNEWLEDLHTKADEIKRQLSYLDGSIGSYGCRIDELNLPTS